MNRSFVTGYCVIKENWVETLGGGRIHFPESSDFLEFMKSLYNNCQLDYPKFYKMDNLCKIAFIAAEYLVKQTEFKSKYKDAESGIILQNKSSSIDSDSRHAESFRNKDNYFPSPSVFVYTLPNIAIGEICIRNGIKGENALFVSEKFNVPLSVNYIQSLIENGKVESCLGGWFEYSQAGYEAYMFFVEKESKLDQMNKSLVFNVEEIKKIYNKI